MDKKQKSKRQLQQDEAGPPEVEQGKRESLRNQEVFRLLVSGVQDYAIYMLDPAGYVVTWNEGAQRMHGYGDKEIIGRHFSQFYSESEKAAFHPQKHIEIARDRGRFEEESWRAHKDGTLFWANVIITAIYDGQEFIGFAKVTRDLTQQREAARQAQESSQKEKIYRSLVSGVKDYAIFMLDPNGCVMTWNDGAKKIKGYEESEILGKHFSIFYSAEATKSGHPRKELELALRNGRYEEEGWRIRKDGTEFWANVVITPIYDRAALIGFAKVTRDLTERKHAEEREKALIEREAIFKLLVSGVKDYAIFMLDPNGCVLTWNEGAERIKGYSAQEILGSHFSRFYTQEAKTIGHPSFELKEAQEKGVYEEEGWRVRKDGSQFWASVVITAIRKDGKLIGFAKVTRDLTEQRKHEQQLQSANEELRQSLDVKSRFLSTISHEVRTPMSGVISLAELLSLSDLGEENNQMAADLFASAQRLLSMLNDLLDAAKMESNQIVLEYKQFPLQAVLADVRQLVQPLARNRKLELFFSCASDVPEILCGDELRLRQVLLNLAFNAVKFTDRGQVKINCTMIRQIAEEVVLVRFEVSDTGIGIAKEAQNQLFKPFAQVVESTKRIHGGSGLGLNICKKLVELMGGRIGVESEPGKGSTFWIEIPFSEANCSSAQNNSSASKTT